MTGRSISRAAGKAGHHRRHGGELQRLQRVGPALGVAEKVVQPFRLRARVAAPGRLDPDLAPQRDRFHLLAAGLADPQHQRQGGHHRVPVRPGPDAVEGQLGHVRAPAGRSLALTPPPRALLALTPPPHPRAARTRADLVEELGDALRVPPPRRRSRASAGASARRARSRRRSAPGNAPRWLSVRQIRAASTSGAMAAEQRDGLRRAGPRPPGRAGTRWRRPGSGRSRSPRRSSELRRKNASPTGISSPSHSAAVSGRAGSCSVPVGHRPVPPAARPGRA